MNYKLGLVLAGGGGKGSYEIGVWKYLREIGLDSKISVISGTSVGGLNAFLIAYNDFDIATQIWTKEISAKILDIISDSHKNGAIFSRQGLLDIIDKYIDFSKVKDFDKCVYVTCHNMDKSRADYIKLNNLSRRKIEKYLLATSAIPIVFENERFLFKSYCDGGVTDNVPLKPLVDEQCTHAIIVSLKTDKHIDYSKSGIKTIDIYPSSNLGNFLTGTLDFTPANAKARIELGYNDCKNIFASALQELI